MQLKRTPLARVLVGCACALALLPHAAYAVSPEAPLGEDFDEIVAQAQSGEERDAFAPEEGFMLQTQAERPAYFDLRHVLENGVEKSYVTPVREQSPFGSCWGFAAISAAESSILSAGLAADPLTLNLSEKQVVWFSANKVGDPDSPQYGEGLTFGYDVVSADYYNTGGQTYYATSLFSAGTGPVSEATDTNYGKIFAYGGLNGEVVNDEVTWIDENGVEQRGFRKVYYSEDDDWSIPEAYRFWQDYKLDESYLLPSPAVCKTDEELEAANNAIKDQLLSHHAVAINFCAATSLPGQESKFNDVLSENWAQYDSTHYPSNHAVTIVGYDDTYPKSNFATEPPADGAWLVKNSWGSDLCDFPDNSYRHWGLLEGMDVVGSDYQATSQKHTGYFWLSYYDGTIRDPEAYAFEAGESDVIVDQHDFMSVTDYQQYATEGPNRMANIFVASQDEKLEEISFLTTTPGMNVAWRVYLLEDDAEGPEDGVCVASADGLAYAYGGYHRVPLAEDEQVFLAKGQRYAIVVEQRTPSGKYSITVNTAISYATSYNGAIWYEGVVNEGESLFYVDGAWRDLSDESIRNVFEDGDESFDNFSIKGYASAAEVDPDGKQQPDPPEKTTRAPFLEVRTSGGALAKDCELEMFDQVKYKCTIRGATDDIEIQPTFTWRVTDESVVAVEPNEEREGAEAVVRPLHEGEVDVTVDAGIYGSCTVHVTVHGLKILSGELAEEDREVVYTGQAFEPDLAEVRAHSLDGFSTTDVTRDVDYVVSYEDNVQCGRAEVILRGIGDYGGEVRTNNWVDLSFWILPAKPQITQVTSGAGRIAVQFASQEESGISGYELSWKEVDEEQQGELVAAAEGEASGQTKRLSADATSASITGLNEGATYEVSLRAYVTTTDIDHEEYEEVVVDHFGESSDPVTCVASASDSEDDEPDAGKDDSDSKKDDSGSGSNSGSGSKSDSGSGSKSSSSSKGASGASSKSSSSAKKQSLARTGDIAYPIAPAFVAGFALVAGGLVLRRVRQRR